MRTTKLIWTRKGGVLGILEHSKINYEGIFFKNRINHKISIFGVFLTYRILEKIALDIETRKKGFRWLISYFELSGEIDLLF